MARDNKDGTVTVQSGDTLSSIAKAYNTTVTALAKLNPEITNVNKIRVGQVIRVSSSSAPATSNPTPAMASRPVVDKWGLVSNSDRELYAGWSFNNHANVDHYEYIWYYSWGVGVAMESSGSTTSMACTYSAPEHATHVSFIVRAVAKKDRDSKGNEVSRFPTTSYSEIKTYWYKDNPPKTPPTPDVEIEDYTLTATLDGLEDLNAEYIEFHVYQDNGHIVASTTSPHVPIVTYHAEFSCTIEPGHDYKVQARAWRGELHSDWSGYTGNQGTAPAASGGITVLKANSTSSVYLEWQAVSNAESYDIEYTTKKEYFDSSDQTQTISGIETNTYIKTGLEIGQEYFFRVRAVNENGHSAWTASKSIILGKTPSAPTTWSSTTKAIVGEPLTLYWVHNSEDGSKQVTAELELNINGNVTTHTIQKEETPEDEEEKTSSYSFDTSGYVEGTILKWRVRTCGITGEYSEWSIQRVVDIYAKPSLALNLLDLNGSWLETLTSFPFRITGTAGPSTQKPIGWHVSITANVGYETVDHIGRKTIVLQNGVVYSKYFDIYDQLDVVLSAQDLDL
jgi:murein DD-endopeptidase MepM/ murein hydrolase activator NlpD